MGAAPGSLLVPPLWLRWSSSGCEILAALPTCDKDTGTRGGRRSRGTRGEEGVRFTAAPYRGCSEQGLGCARPSPAHQPRRRIAQHRAAAGRFLCKKFTFSSPKISLCTGKDGSWQDPRAGCRWVPTSTPPPLVLSPAGEFLGRANHILPFPPPPKRRVITANSASPPSVVTVYTPLAN